VLEDYLPSFPDLISNPTNKEFIMKQGMPKIVAWLWLLQEKFHNRLQTCCSPHGETKPTVVTAHSLQSGLVGMSKGIEIPPVEDVIKFLAELTAL